MSDSRLPKYCYICKECDVIHFNPVFPVNIIAEQCPLKQSKDLREHHEKILEQLNKKEYLNV